MILCIGEILIDQIEIQSECGLVIEKHLGGAPFNVFFNAYKNKKNSYFVGAIGNDENGKLIKEYSEKISRKNIILQEVNKKTTIAHVKNDINGERSFTFTRTDTSDYNIDFDQIPRSILDKSNIIHLGSLIINEKKGKKLANKIINYAKLNSKKLSFDVNYRSDVFKNEQEAISTYKKYIDSANILKFSIDELQLFSSEYELEKAIKKIYRKDLILVVTFGSEGSFYKYNDFELFVKSEKVKAVDTTGAGDAFYGTFLSYIDSLKNFDNYDEIYNVLKKANGEGAKTTLFKGAISIT